MNKIEQFRDLNRDYLTFYHEIRTPEHEFFSSEGNQDDSTRILMLSSPSRMGNHLLLSMLDGHPQLPRIPGEDGFLSFSFYQANYDLHNFLAKIRSPDAVEYMKLLSTNLFFDKWLNMERCWREGVVPEGCSGVRIKERPAGIDYQGTVVNVNYGEYSRVLTDGVAELKRDSFREYLNIYLKAMLYLDPERADRKGKLDGYISYSGMRGQIRWALEHYSRARLITSLRPFDSYAVSHIKSRYQNADMTPELLQEAWEHWYHKVIDYLYLKSAFPDRVCLVSFDDLVANTEAAARAICRFLDISYDPCMLVPTLFGCPVKGNSARAQDDKMRGRIYSDRKRLEKNRIPEDGHHLWKAFETIKSI